MSKIENIYSDGSKNTLTSTNSETNLDNLMRRIEGFETRLNEQIAKINREIKENIEAVKILNEKRESLFEMRENLESLLDYYESNKKKFGAEIAPATRKDGVEI